MEEDCSYWLENVLHICDRELFDIQLLDEVVGCMNDGSGESQRNAKKTLTALKEHPYTWMIVETILERSQNPQTRYFALQILENGIELRRSRPDPEEIRKYIVDLIIKTYSDPTLANEGKPYREKLNDILVQIVKQNLLKNWSPFMDEMIAESNINESLCKNTMVILKQLSEKLLGQTNLKGSMCNEFDQVFQLCQCVLENSQNTSLVDATLNTLILFLNWILLEDIFETGLIPKLVCEFLVMPMFRNITLKCLTKIAGINVQGYEEEFKKLFWTTITKLRQMLPTTINMESANASGSNDEQNFIQNTASFLCIFFEKHVNLIENKPDLQALLLDIRLLLITRMAQPADVLVLVENEQGEVVGEFIQDADSINLYWGMKRTLVYLTRLDYKDTTRIMTEKLHNQGNGTELSWKNLNTLCWAIGSISSCAAREEDGRKFFFTVLRGLIALKRNRTDNDRRIIASNIMFIGGQYRRCLISNWKTLKKFTNLLFDFMHDAHDSIKVMACDTFLKLAQECPRQFLQKQAGEDKPFIEEIINFISTKTGNILSTRQLDI